MEKEINALIEKLKLEINYEYQRKELVPEYKNLVKRLLAELEELKTY